MQNSLKVSWFCSAGFLHAFHTLKILMKCANGAALLSGTEAQQIDAIPPVVSCCVRTLSSNMEIV